MRKVHMIVGMLTLMVVSGFQWNVHDVHVSVSAITLTDQGMLQVSMNIFLDDFANAIEQDPPPNQITDSKEKLEWYIQQHFVVSSSSNQIRWNLQDVETRFPAATCILVSEDEVDLNDELNVRYSVLTELFDDQVNIIEVELHGFKTKTYDFRPNSVHRPITLQPKE